MKEQISNGQTVWFLHLYYQLSMLMIHSSLRYYTFNINILFLQQKQHHISQDSNISFIKQCWMCPLSSGQPYTQWIALYVVDSPIRSGQPYTQWIAYVMVVFIQYQIQRTIIGQRMKMKLKQSQNNQLHSFIVNLISLQHFTLSLPPLLPTDSTSIPTLQEIYQDSKHDRSYNGKRLRQSSEKLLKMHHTIKREFGQYISLLPTHTVNSIPHAQQLNTPSAAQCKRMGQRQIKVNRNLKRKKFPIDLSDEIVLNNQNVNSLNNMHSAKGKGQVVNGQLRQILRPQYTKKFNEKSSEYEHSEVFFDERKQVKFMNESFNQRYLTEYEQYEDIPILSQKNKGKIHTNSKKDRSVSPKIENRKKKDMANSMSSISRNKQTNTDVSFQIDLHRMGFVANQAQRQYNEPRQVKSRANLIELLVCNNKCHERLQGQHENDKISNNYEKVVQKIQSSSIQEEQPWECDEEQIEEQIRQINQRLSHRTNNKVEKSRQTNEVKPKDPSHSYISLKKQTKTVRLSLTPKKNKNLSSNNRKARRNQFQQIQIIKTPIRNKWQDCYKQSAKIVGPKSPLNNQFGEYSPLEMECAKWKKPSKGLISLQIKKLSKMH